MKCRSSLTRNLGFTLIEMVISSALMSVILVSSYLCLRAGFASQKTVESRADALQTARVAMGLMASDIRAACPLCQDFEFLGLHRLIGNMQADNLDFATHNYTPRRLRESDWCEASYYLARAPHAASYSLWRRRDPTPDSEPLSGGTREEIATRVAGLRFEYYDGYEWFDEWGDPNGRARYQNASLQADNLSGMPEAVRITLWLGQSDQEAESDSNRKTGEPPLMFQTVVRLELAAATRRMALSDSTNVTSNPEPTQQTPVEPQYR